MEKARKEEWFFIGVRKNFPQLLSSDNVDLNHSRCEWLLFKSNSSTFFSCILIARRKENIFDILTCHVSSFSQSLTGRARQRLKLLWPLPLIFLKDKQDKKLTRARAQLASWFSHPPANQRMLRTRPSNPVTQQVPRWSPHPAAYWNIPFIHF